MKKIAITIISVTLLLSSCGGTSEKQDFESFWAAFQTMIAANDKDAILLVCENDYVKDNIVQVYDMLVNERMQAEVAKTKATDVEDMGNDSKLFSYDLIYEDANTEYGEAGSSAFGFWFKKVDGKWKISEPHMAG